MRTYSAKPSEVDRQWHVVDASGLTLGRLATELAKILRGKHKPIYTPHIDTGDFVIVVNAEKIAVSGKKTDQKVYYHHSGFLGGLKETPFSKVLTEKPERIVTAAVRGMLPHTRLGRAMLTKLKVYAGPEHPHKAQNPKPLTVST